MKQLVKNNYKRFVSLVLVVAMVFTCLQHIGPRVAKAEASNDVTGMVNSVTIDIDGNTVTGDKWAPIYPDTEYMIHLNVKETVNVSEKQFDVNYIEYELPEGFNANNVNDTASIKVRDIYGTFTLSGNKYTIVDNKLKIEWNKENEELYNRLLGCGNVNITLDIKGTFDETVNQLDFGNGIVKDVEISNDTDIAVEKTSTYENGKVYYTVKVNSHGSNSNVNVVDQISGGILSFDSATLNVKSNKKENVAYTNTTETDGFNMVIPSMENGETIEITYTADANLSNSSSANGMTNSTETLNSVSVTSEEDDDPDNNETSTTNEGIVWSSISKSSNVGSDYKDPDTGKSYRNILYTVTVNPEMVKSLAGTVINDTFATSVPTDFPKPVFVVVTDKDGNTVRSNEVSNTANGWSYNVPDNDGVYTYTFTHLVRAEVTSINSAANIRNVAEFEYGETATSDDILPIPGNKLEVHKSVAELTGTTVTWRINVHVPATGAQNLVVKDTIPNNLDVGVWDSFDYDSVEVSGLPEGVTYERSVETADYIKWGDGGATKTTFDKVFVLTFGEIPAQDGGTDFSVVLTTEVNENWFQKSQEENGTWLQGHTNTVDVIDGKQSAKDTATAIPTRKNLVKKTVSLNSTKSDGNGGTYNIYEYNVFISGVDTKNFEITDIFDTRYLRISTDSNFNKAYIYGGDQYYQGSGTDIPVTVTETATGAIFTITPESIKLENADAGVYYPYYRINYFLEEINTEQMREEAIASGDAMITLSNTAKLDEATVSASYERHFSDFISKTILNENELGKRSVNGDEIRTAKFRIAVNEAGEQLNKGNDLTLTDEYENMSVDYTTIKVINADSGEDITDLVKYDATGYTITFTVPDETPMIITYDAMITGDGSVNYKNTFSYKGSAVTKSGNVNYEHHEEGVGSTPSVKIFKYEKGDMTKPLSGAIFYLYKSGSDEPVKYKVAKDGHNIGDPIEFVTDDTGEAIIFGNSNTDQWQLEENIKYYLKEVVAPKGYGRLTYNVEFTITDGTAPDYTNYVFLDGDIVTVKNEPVETTSVTAGKIWKDEDGVVMDTAPDGASVIFELYSDGIATGQTITLDGTADENGENSAWTAVFSGIAKYASDNTTPIVYTVKEREGFDGYTVESETGVADGGSIANQKDKDEFAETTATKIWWNANNNEMDAPDNVKITFELYRKTELSTEYEATGITVVLDGTPDGEGGTAAPTSDYYEKEPWMAYFGNLAKSDKDGHPYTYTVKEVSGPTGFTPENNGFADKDGSIINKQEEISVSATKEWILASGATLPEDAAVMFGLYERMAGSDGEPLATVVLDGTADTESTNANYDVRESAPWTASFGNLPKYKYDTNGNAVPIVYVIKEKENALRGFTNQNPNGVVVQDSNGNVSTGSITNKQETIKSITAGKVWADEDGTELSEIPTGVYAIIGLYDDTTKDPIRTITLDGTVDSTDVSQEKESGEVLAWTANFVDLPKYKADGTEILYYVKEIECSDGFGTENKFYGYNPEGDPIEIVNKQILINIDFQKEWKDPENYTIDPPDNASVEFTLLKDGVDTGRKVVLDGSEDTDEYKNSHEEFESNRWQVRFINLPEYRYDSEGAHKIEYKVRETKGYPGFTPVGDSDEHNKITNKKDVVKINLSVTKAWLDVNELPSTAPKDATVTLALYTRMYDFSDPEDDTPLDGRQIVLNGTASTDAYINEHDTYASGAWTATFANLPKYKYESGYETEIIYVVKVISEENCTGYKLLDEEIVLGGDTISGTVHNMQENTSVSVSKSWKDLNNEENIQLGANVVFSLFKRTGSGETVVDTPVTGKTVTLDGSEDSEGENSPWEASFNNLPKYSYDSDGNATEIVYVVKETTPYTGYTASYKNGDAALNGETITNTQTTITAKVLKVWDDADNHDGARPESIAVTLKNGEEIVHSTNLSAQNEWTASVSGLPMYSYDEKGVATEINYTWTEDDTAEKAGYTLSSTVVSQLTDTEGTLTTLTNSRGIEKVSVSAKKVWQNGSGTTMNAPANITTTFELYRNGEKTNKTVTLNGEPDVLTEPIPESFESAEWTARFDNLEKNDNTGNPYVYTVKEVSAPTGFTNLNPDGVVVQNSDGLISTGTITNKQVEISVSASKEWILASGTTLPENAAVMFGLYERMAGSDGDIPLATVVLDGTADTESRHANYDVRESASWTASFGNLPKYKYDTNGNAVPIIYVIKENENALHGFTNQNTEGVVVQKADGTVSTGTITNKQDVVEITVSKKWQNANGSQNAPANANIVFTLFADNTATDKTITLDGTVDSTDVSQGKESGELAAWTANFVDLPKYDTRTGNEIAYTVKETTGYTGYTVSYGNADADSASDEGTITNIQDVKKLSVRKIWDDSNNQDGKRPESLVMTLSNEIVGEERTVTLNVEGEWKGEIDNLPVYRDGVEIVYTWTEGDTPEGYTLSGAPVTDKDGLTTFTNKYDTEMVSATVIKNWEDGNNRDGIRPRSITVKLFADGVDTGKTAVLNADNSYTETIDGLPKYKDGNVIAYTWQEPEITGYELTGDSTSNYTTTITNTHETATTQVSVTKVWNNADGTDNAPEGANVVFELYANGVSTGKTVILDGTKDEPTGTAAVYDYESAAWTASFTNLDLNENGNKITYTVKEKTGFTGYSVSYGGAETDSAINGGSITNNQDVIEVLAGKKWKNADGSQTAPEGASVVFTLFADGKATNNTVKLDGMPDVILGDSSADCLESKAWTAMFKKLPEYDYASGTPAKIVYTVQETTGFTGYTASYPDAEADSVSNGGNITNTQGVIGVTAGKKWKNADGSETAPEGASVVFMLYADGNATDRTVTLNGTADTEAANYESEAWTASFTGLPEYSYSADKAPEKIVYTVKETTPFTGYAAESDETAAGGNITNAEIVVSVSAIKAWSNVDNTTTAPKDASVVFTLYADDKITDRTVTLDGKADELTGTAAVYDYESAAWTASFTNLPKYRTGTTIEIVYTIDETSGTDGYTKGNRISVTNGGTIINRQNVTKLSVKKIWNDSENQDGKRPVSLTVTLNNGSTDVGSVTLSDNNGWQDSISNLPKYDYTTGKKYEYSWSEGTLPEGYRLTNNVDSETTDGTLTTLTNSYTPGKTEATVKKVWNDAENQDAIRPASISVQLMAGDEAYGDPIVLNDANEWKATVSNLEEYAGGNKIEYSWTEVSVPAGYVAAYSAQGTITTITNTHVPETAAISVSKAWVNADGSTTAPDGANVTFSVFEDGKTDVLATVTLDGSADKEPADASGAYAYERAAWTASYKNLPKYRNVDGMAVEIKYVVKETTAYAGYTASYANGDSAADGETITNSEIKTSISVNKVWSNADTTDTAPAGASIVFTLYADGTATDKTITLDGLGDDNGEKTAWHAVFENLPKYKTGTTTEIVYTVDETSGADGYTKTNTDPVANGGTITNSQDVTTHFVEKIWEDANNQDGKRPTSLTVTLSNGSKNVGEVSLNENNKWKGSISGLPVYDYTTGKKYEYSWSEGTLPEGYRLTNNVDSETTDGTLTTLTNSYTPGKTEATVKKVWNDAENQDAIRPASISVQLMAGDEAYGDPIVLNDANEWKATVSNLEEYAGGNKIEYSWTEVSVPAGYVAAYSAQGTITTITNTHVPETAAISVSKAWVNADGSTTAPNGANVTFSVFEDGKTDALAAVTLDGSADSVPADTLGVTGYESAEWTASFINLPKYRNADGKAAEIKYVVKETTAYVGYTASYENGDSAADGETITNTQETIEFTGIKNWVNADGSDTAPEGCKVTLEVYRDTNATGRTVELDGTVDTAAGQFGSETASWTATFTSLPKYDTDGKEITDYRVMETNLLYGYTVTYDNQGYTTTLTNTQQVTSVTASKQWQDADGKVINAPAGASVVFGLMILGGDGKPEKTIILDGVADENGESESWTAEFTDLPAYKYNDGVASQVEYYVTELTGFDGFEKVVNGDVDGVLPKGTIVNKQVLTSVSAKKAWLNNNLSTNAPRGASVVFTLFADGVATDKTITLDGTVDENGESASWTASFTGLPQYKYEAGKAPVEIKYTVKETGKYDRYTPDKESVENGGTITNSDKIGKTSLTVTKVWVDENDRDNVRPEEIRCDLYANGRNTDKNVFLNEANNWTASISDLDKNDQNGIPIKYTWKESLVGPYYKLTDTSEEDGVTTLTNTHEINKITVSATKAWLNVDGTATAPSGATAVFGLFVEGNDTPIATVSLDGTADTESDAYESAAWTASFKNLPENKEGASGVKIEYVVREITGFDGYESDSIDGVKSGNTITNAQIKTSISVKKVWSNADQTDTAPKDASVVFTLYADGAATGRTVTLDGVTDSDGEATAWIASFDNLPKYKTGTTTEIVYTVDETSGVQGYTKTNNTSVTNGEIITNKQDVTELSVAKVWDDAENQDGKRPLSLTVTLNNGSTEVGSVVLSNGNNWTGSISGLPVYDYTTGNKLVYSWSEGTLPDGYSMTKSEDSETEYGTLTTITNSYTPGKVSVSVKKVWDDAENQDGKRPASVSVELKNGNTVIETVELNEANKWTATVSDLDEYAAGNKIVYTWSEVTTGMPEGYELSDSVTEGQVTTLTNSYAPETIGVSVKKAWINADKTIEAPDGANAVFGLFEKDGTDPIATITLDGIVDAESGAYESAAWTASFVNLPRYRAGEEIEYVVKETVSYAGYTVSYASGDSAKDGETITNTQDVVSISVKKEWSNADGTATAPKDASVVFTLYADGNAVDGKTISLDGAADSNGEKTAWIAKFEALPKYKTGTTTEIVYTVDETSGVTGYTKTNASAVADGGTITNKQDVTQLSVKKVWDDSNDQDGKRPESLTVTLSNGSKNAGSVTLNEANSWTATISNLPVYDYVTGNKLTYLWNEGDMPEGYSLTDMSDSETADGKLTTLTNSYEPGKIAMTVRKVWDDADNQDGVRPESLDVLLLDEKSKVVDIVTLNEDNGWTGTIDDLDEYGNKVKRVYTWSEDAKGLPEGYELTNIVTEGQITTLTNTYVPETVEIKVNKAWLNADGSTDAPDGANVVFALFTRETDGETVTETDLGMTVTLDGAPDETDGEAPAAFCESESWTAVFKNLPKYKPGESGVELTYFVKEITEYADYTNLNPEGVADGETITNKQDTGSILIRKTIKGDITDEDRAGLTFVVKDKDGNEVGSYKLGVDFDEEKDDNDVVTGYSKTIEVPVGEYTVEETLYKFDGTTVTVSYKVDGGEAKEGDITEAFEVGKEKTTVVEYENMYEEDKKTDNESQSSSGSTSGDNDERGPKTGDDMSVKALAVIAVISVTAAFFLKKKEEEE